MSHDAIVSHSPTGASNLMSPFDFVGGATRYQPTSASATAWRSFIGLFVLQARVAARNALRHIELLELLLRKIKMRRGSVALCTALQFRLPHYTLMQRIVGFKHDPFGQGGTDIDACR